jgi:gentisate 1,2-dioxygenase
LARRAHIPPNNKPDIYPSDEPVIWADKGVLDPPSVAILEKAFHQAWDDLKNGDQAADKEVLARCLSQLIKTERDPARLAAKAVIKLILLSK